MCAFCFRWWSWAAPQHNGGRGRQHRGQHPSPEAQGQVLDPWQDLQAVEVEEEKKQREVQRNFWRFVLQTCSLCECHLYFTPAAVSVVFKMPLKYLSEHVSAQMLQASLSLAIFSAHNTIRWIQDVSLRDDVYMMVTLRFEASFLAN